MAPLGEVSQDLQVAPVGIMAVLDGRKKNVNISKIAYSRSGSNLFQESAQEVGGGGGGAIAGLGWNRQSMFLQKYTVVQASNL